MCSLELKFALIGVGGGVVKVAGGPASYLLDLANTLVALAESSLEIFHFILLWGGTDWGRMISSWGVRMRALCVEQLKNISSFGIQTIYFFSSKKTHLLVCGAMYWLGALTRR